MSVVLCFSTGEYTCPVWSRSAHAGMADVKLNEICGLTTGCLTATPLAKLYQAASFNSPSSRRNTLEINEKFKQTFDNKSPTKYSLSGSSSGDISCSFGTWRMLNRIRMGVAPVKDNLITWIPAQPNDDMCDGVTQNMEHLLECSNRPAHFTIDNL
ncbi:hypothetical protein Trydic_g16675 [Trypoxylus dichotomus]